MNKLDMRDYLYHAYNVRTTSVRSYIQQQKVRQGKPSSTKPAIKRWYRPRAMKKMTVEMEQPFVWPAEPTAEDLDTKWNRNRFNQSREDNEEYSRRGGRLADTLFSTKDREAMREQAQKLLDGVESWQPGMDRK